MVSLEYIYKEDEEYYDSSSSTTSSKARGLFRSLKTLQLRHLDRLKGLGSGRRRREVVPTSTASSSSSSTAKELLLTSSSFGLVKPHFPVLEDLSIRDCPQLDLSADDDDEKCVQFQNLPSLTRLTIKKMPKLVSLTAVQYLTSLRHLRIEYCDLLTSLPDSMRHLTALQDLAIRKCPNLTKRCQKVTGEDWPKIAHIPSVIVEDTRCT